MADNPYVSQTLNNYNNNPPPDDGSQVAANEVEWAKHIDKIGDPLRVFSQAIDSQVLAAFAQTINIGADQENTMGGSLAFTSSELTITGGVISATRTYHTVDTQSDASTDDLDSINPAAVGDGAVLILRAQSASRIVVVKHQVGGAPNPINLANGLDFSLDDLSKRIVLQRDGSQWYEVARSAPQPTNVVYKIKTDVFTTNSTTFVDVTDAEVTITKQRANTLIKVEASGIFYHDTDGRVALVRLIRDSTPIAIGDPSGNRIGLTSQSNGARSSQIVGVSALAHSFIDAPGAAGDYVYKIQMRSDTATGLSVIGRNGLDTDNIANGRFPTSLICTEIDATESA